MMSDGKFIQDQFFPSLGALAEPEHFHGPIELGDAPPDLLQAFLSKMIQIRSAEERIGAEVSEGKVKCPCHLVIGQEAPPTALAPHLKPGDKVFGAHRSHAHYLALGGDLYRLFAEIQGKDHGCSRGMGGSMHLIDRTNQLYGTVPIVGATIPIAVGAGLAAKMSRKEEVAVSFFGDGAAEEGILHESLNLAASMKLPVVFFCENNLFSSHLHISLRQPSDCIARFAHAHQIPSITLDGNDVVALHESARKAVDMCRRDEGPVFIEAVTYRWCGHVGPREDLDVGVKRKDNLAKWKKRDPIGRLHHAMEVAGVSDSEHLESLWKQHRCKVDEDWNKAVDAPFPNCEELLSRVYSSAGS